MQIGEIRTGAQLGTGGIRTVTRGVSKDRIKDFDVDPLLPGWLTHNTNMPKRIGLIKKRCPRCGGCLFIEWDSASEAYITKCLNCSAVAL